MSDSAYDDSELILPKAKSSTQSYTLDLLADCLDSVHRTRKANLSSRAKAHEIRTLRRREHAQAMSRLAVRSNLPTAYNADGDMIEDDDNQLLESFSSQMATAPQISPPPPSKQDKQSSKKASGRQDGNSPLFRGAIDGFDSLESKKDDMKAATYFEEFKHELQGWWHSGSNQSRRQEIEARGDFADYMTDKYMCKKLDPMPPSKIISSVRKDISKILEEFAGAGMLPSNFTDVVFEIVTDEKQLHRSLRDATDSAAELRLKTKMREIERDEGDVNVESDDEDEGEYDPVSVSNSKLATDTTTASNSSNGKKKVGVDPAAKLISEEKEKKVYDAVQANAARKKELEKMKVRQQYEAYMKLKSSSEIKYDVEKAKEYEDLNSDIRSLISSIGQVQENATNLKTKKVL